jgi:PIN domain nuclease of toxin-antitoxin system
MPIQLSHILRVTALPALHHDPFDRLLIAQSLAENLPLVTSDGIFARYGVKTIW